MNLCNKKHGFYAVLRTNFLFHKVISDVFEAEDWKWLLDELFYKDVAINGKVDNKDALNYLFYGFAPAMDQQAISMGYSGATQMKDAVANGNINVGSFVTGFTNTVKGLTDFSNKLKSKESLQENNNLELDITFNHNEQYQAEAPDRRVQDGISYAEVLHNMPDIFSLDCGLQDKKRYSVTEFNAILTNLRTKKTPFSMIIGEDRSDTLILQNFNPSVLGARSGLDHTLELKKIRIGSVETVPIVIKPIPNRQSGNDTAGGAGTSDSSGALPNYLDNIAEPMAAMVKNKNRSWAKIIIEPSKL